MIDSERPDIYAYTAYRQYLSDWFAWKKQQGPPFSHRIFARRLGSKDPSVLSNIIKGHRGLAETRIPLFAKAMDLDNEETEFFGLLVKLGQAGPGEQHERAWAALTEYRVRRQGPSIVADQVKFLSNLYFSAIRTLAECDGFRNDASWIASQLRPRLDPEVVVEALDTLVRLGWLVRDGDDLSPATPTLTTAERVLQLGSYGYHRDSLRLASGVMDDMHEPDVTDETGFLGLTIAVSESRIGDLRRLIWEALVKAAHQAEEWTEPSTRVIQMSVQMFPLSESLAADESTS